MSKHSFPPRLSDAEYQMLQSPLNDTWNWVVVGLLKRGLLCEQPNAADGWPEVTRTKRGALMLARAARERTAAAGT